MKNPSTLEEVISSTKGLRSNHVQLKSIRHFILLKLVRIFGYPNCKCRRLLAIIVFNTAASRLTRFLGAFLSLALVFRWNCMLFFFASMKCLHSMMGGDRCRTEPISCDEFKDNAEVWAILQKGGVTPFME